MLKRAQFYLTQRLKPILCPIHHTFIPQREKRVGSNGSLHSSSKKSIGQNIDFSFEHFKKTYPPKIYSI